MMICAICRKPVPGRKEYCPRCKTIMKKAHADFIAHREALKEAWSDEADGFLCHYSGIRVDELDPASPWHISFDHPIPKKPGKLYVTVQLFNSMKKDLTDKEFRLAVLELARKFAGGKFRKNIIRFRHWFRLARPIRSLTVSPFPLNQERLSDCEICQYPAPSKGKYCQRCNGFILHHTLKAARATALKDAWDPKRRGFVCHYTGILLEESDFHDPWYLTFDHPDPNDPGRLVVAAAWVNGMKTDLTEEEFRSVIAELARHFETGAPFDMNVAKLNHWIKMARARISARRRRS